MTFFEKITDDEENLLSEALFNYDLALTRGNYSTLDDYTKSIWGWDDSDEIEAVYYMLQPLLSILLIEGIDSTALKDQLRQCLPIGFRKIAHLSASLHIMKNQAIVELHEELEGLKGIGILVQVEANMPVPCLIYLGALRQSNLDDILKLQLIDCMIIKMENSGDIFGHLSHLVLRTAIKYWFDVFNKTRLNLNENLKLKIEKYNAIKKEVDNFSVEKLSLIERYMLLSCQKLRNDIGKIELVSSFDRTTEGQLEKDWLYSSEKKYGQAIRLESEKIEPPMKKNRIESQEDQREELDAISSSSSSSSFIHSVF